MTQNKLYKTIDGIKTEMTSEEKEAFLADIEATNVQIQLREAEYKAKQDARDSAIKKLGEIAGLTKEELDAIL
jgi:hypothetical protein